MNSLAKRVLGSCSGASTPRTSEEIEEAKRIRHRAYLRAGEWFYDYEQGQIANIQRLRRDSTRYS